MLLNCHICVRGLLLLIKQYESWCEWMNSSTCLTTYVELRSRKHFPCFHTVIETRVEVWENEKLKWEHEHAGRVFPRYFEFSQTSTSISITVSKHGKCFLFLNCDFSNSNYLRLLIIGGHYWLFVITDYLQTLCLLFLVQPPDNRSCPPSLSSQVSPLREHEVTRNFLCYH